ncbi:hypothetical protein SAMD00019534_091730 [Acytostelium subglobosum LB1]|uniref:hypothetical protein n=1 Tax=Acytostelium subglobosum LB1 TaxID=1410327 RepID=UPI000644EABF|nr:hypothetical protein SAMD00019534_091730 [Acytostelium subglobosum LB1]GAM25998.1 hypothetical protein SAMD00019534_091730 [Acytostelium subglobosum LB1]|eukprot:XP_012751041.1 hypothetical protein SAMD00019534_091730 [Acytostelium subglobosum LB1]
MASAEFYIFQWGSIIFLVSLSGLFAGLTLGIMSLDITGLEIIIASGDPRESKYAKKIYPVRQRGNLLLCTLLLGNVSVNSLLSILLADITSGFVGFLLSTVIILLAGEIIPQASCSRHALAVGAHTIWVVYIFIFIFFPVAYPISCALDFVLGREMGTIYSRHQLKKLLDIHSAHAMESGVSRSDVTMLTGVLDFGQKKVAQVMTPLEQVFMLDIESKLDINMMTSILENGHSRMPVYEGDRTNIVGCLHMRDLVLLNPEDGVPLKTVIGLFHRQLLKTWHDTSLEQMLNEFKTGKSHMAIVHKVNSDGDGDPFYENLGIICLEDVLEEILQDEILDEADHYESGTNGAVDYKTIGSFHGTKTRTPTKISSQQMIAVHSFLSGCMPEFSSKLISETAFRNMLSNKGAMVVEYDKPKKGDQFIYKRGVSDTFFTIVLQGKLEIKSGGEGFVSEGGPFSTLGINALKEDQFIPDFSARVTSANIQLLRINKPAYDAAIKATTEEYNTHVFKRGETLATYLGGTSTTSTSSPNERKPTTTTTTTSTTTTTPTSIPPHHLQQHTLIDLSSPLVHGTSNNINNSNNSNNLNNLTDIGGGIDGHNGGIRNSGIIPSSSIHDHHDDDDDIQSNLI